MTTDRLSDRIFNLIASGKYDPGQKLNEVELGARLGVSRTPVRDALKELHQAGVVVLEARKGARVAEYSKEYVVSLYEARAALEPLVAQLALPHLTDRDIEELVSANTELAQARTHDIDGSHPSTANNDFHRILLSACPNKQLTAAATSLLQPLVISRTFFGYSPSQADRSINYHWEIIESIRARDGDWLHAVMKAHIHASLHNTVQQV